MYRALYRKWRPQHFEDVVGQTDIVTALKNQLLHERVGHAYLFTGTRGTGKTTCAKIFAKAVNCPTREGAEPCGQCAVCRGIDDGSVTDVVEIDAASNNSVNDIRALREESVYTPSACAYKVYIIDEVHMLSREAFNALLKIMEEPPSHVIFILATTEVHKVPATILSRCQRYDFMRIPPDAIAQRLLYVAGQEGIALDPLAAGLIARLADGAMRDALSILDTCAGISTAVDEELVRRMAGVTDRGYLFELSRAVAEKDAGAALRLVAELRERSVDIKRLCDELILHYRNLMLAGMPDGARLLTGVSAEEERRYAEEAPGLARGDAIRAVKTLCAALDQMGKGTDARVELEVALFRLCEDASSAAPVPQTPPRPCAAPQPFAAAPLPPPAAGAPAPAAAPEKDIARPEADAAASAPAPEREPAARSAAVGQAAMEKGAAVPPADAPTPSPAPEKQAAQAPAGAQTPPQPFAAWDAVVAAMEPRDQLLYVYLRESKAYCEGRRVLIDGSELFLDYMRKNEYSSQLIKQAIAEVTGTRYAIGPYRPRSRETAAAQTAEETLSRLAQQGVEVVYENQENPAP